MANDLKVSILTKEKVLYEGRADTVTAPGSLGSMGILKDHAPLMTTLDKGRIVIKSGTEDPKVFECSGKGFLEVFKNNVSILI